MKTFLYFIETTTISGQKRRLWISIDSEDLEITLFWDKKNWRTKVAPLIFLALDSPFSTSITTLKLCSLVQNKYYFIRTRSSFILPVCSVESQDNVGAIKFKSSRRIIPVVLNLSWFVTPFQRLSTPAAPC